MRKKSENFLKKQTELIYIRKLEVVAEQIFLRGRIMRRKIYCLDEPGHWLIVFLEKMLAVDAIGITAQCERPVLQVGQQIWRYPP